MKRSSYLTRIDALFRTHPMVGLLGPRQCGKTTLARDYIARSDSGQVHYFDLEDPADLNRLSEPNLALEGLEGLVVIDEIQRIPELFPLLRVLLDRRPLMQKYLVLGSASRELIRQSSESLAGRIGYLELTPFSFGEVEDLERLWLRGGFPRSFLAENDADSMIWRRHYIANLLERDIPALGIDFNPVRMRRLWTMLSHLHGKVLNFSDLARSLDVSQPTVRRYVDILSGAFLVRQLQPWFANIGKRQVKSPKLYFRDSGLLHYFLGVENAAAVRKHPSLGASWEGFALEEVIRILKASPEDCFFWAKHSQAEIDLLVPRGQALQAFEFKYSSTPKLTPSMRTAQDELGLSGITVICPGEQSYRLNETVRVTNLKEMRASADEPMAGKNII